MSKRHKLIGDAHADFLHLRALLKKHEREWASLTIVGDVGLGFPGTFDVPFESPIPLYFIRGNHDNPGFIRDLPSEWAEAGWHYLPDGLVHDGVLYVGGASSVDRDMRTPGFDWWPEEELTLEEQQAILKGLRSHVNEVHTVVSHDAPFDVYPYLGLAHVRPTRTTTFLAFLLNHVLHEGRLRRWVFGHHHKPRRFEHAGVSFVGLPTVRDGMTLDLVEAYERFQEPGDPHPG